MEHFHYKTLSQGPGVCGDDATEPIIDLDQRRVFTVKGPGILLAYDEECIDDDPQGRHILERHISHLARNVYSITVDEKGLLISVSTNPEDDSTTIPHYPRFSSAQSLQNCSTIELSKLTELDQLGPMVDLMGYIDDSGTQKKVAFKYYMVCNGRERLWQELHITKTIPEHRHLISYDRIVIDDVERRVLGFTTTYAPSQNFRADKTRVFQLKWLQQLTAVVDYLNLELGITHQDIAPQNILVDPETNDLKLFDFSGAAPLGQPELGLYRDDVEDVIFTIHDIITHDNQWRLKRFGTQELEAIKSLEKWPQKAKLDCDVALFREHLDNWARGRKEASEVEHVKKARSPINLPDMPPSTPYISGRDSNGEPIFCHYPTRRRKELLKKNVYMINWERPPYEEAYPERSGPKRKRTD